MSILIVFSPGAIKGFTSWAKSFYRARVQHPKRSSLFIVSLLGSLSVISPFAIDMYLPAYSRVASDFGVESAMIALTLSSYFIGLAFGQVFYGPLLDRYGRKKPLYAGLVIFILASIACGFATNIHMLIVFRFIQALGGCAAQVAGLAMVRDFFPVEEGAKVMSRLFLFISASPLLAPSVGGMLMLTVGWRFVFVILGIIVCLILALVYFLLPEGHKPDPTISLKPGPIIKEYFAIIRHPKFITYALAGAFSFAGLFTYVAGAPIIFMDNFHLSANEFSVAFAGLAVGFIGCSQFNGMLLNKFSSETLFFRVLCIQVIAGLVFMVLAWAGGLALWNTLILFFIFLSCAGLSYPNAAAIALSPFTKNIGSASALLGFLQLGVGALISTGISTSDSREIFPIIAIVGITSVLGLGILFAGRKRAMLATSE